MYAKNIRLSATVESRDQICERSELRVIRMCPAKLADFFKNFSFKKNFLTISATQNFTFEIGNSRVLENIFPEKTKS